MNYNEFAESIKVKYPQYKDIDNRELAQRIVAKYPQYSNITFDDVIEEPMQSQKRGIDLTPGGFVKQIPRALATPIVAAGNKESLGEAWKKTGEAIKQIEKEHPIAFNSVPFATDLYVYSRLPYLKAAEGAGLATKAGTFGANALIQGGIPGALEGLKQGNPLGGAELGTKIAAGIQALPIVGKPVAKVVKAVPGAVKGYAQTFGRLKPKTLETAVNPESIALDLTEDEAQNLLMNTTEDVRNAYNEILAKRGKEVGDAVENLRQGEYNPINIDDVKNDITSAYNQYQYDAINPARELSGELEEDLLNLVEKGRVAPDNTISPTSLQGLKTTIGKMRKNLWEDKKANEFGNPILQQVYGKWADRLSELSPELAQANKRFADVIKFEENEGLNQILRPGDKIGNASSALKNYNNTITKGNINRNVQDFENLLIKEGYEPFLNKIDDINAAQDLLGVRTTGDSVKANLAVAALKPLLRLQRGLNKAEATLQPLRENVGRLIKPSAVKLSVPLQGGIVYNEDRY